MILCDLNIMNIATLITALSALLTGFYLWYDRRARIIVSIEPLERVYYIIIENVGKSVARDVKISIDFNYINSLPVFSDEKGGRIKEILCNIQKRKFYFTPGTKKYYYLMQCPKKNQSLDEFDRMCNEWYETHKFTPFRVSIQYNGWFDYNEEFFIEQFNSEALLYKNSTDKISETLIQIKKEQDKCRSILISLSNTIKKYINGKIEDENS